MSSEITTEALLRWCQVSYDRLQAHPDRRTPLRIVHDSDVMGKLMAQDLLDVIVAKAAGPMAADPADLPWKKLSASVSASLPV